jgi:hypothetical protein
MKLEEQNLNEAESPQLNIGAVMSSAIAFAEWIKWDKYQKFEGQDNLWYDKKSSYSNPIPIKTTEDLWNEFIKHCS